MRIRKGLINDNPVSLGLRTLLIQSAARTPCQGAFCTKKLLNFCQKFFKFFSQNCYKIVTKLLNFC